VESGWKSPLLSLPQNPAFAGHFLVCGLATCTKDGDAYIIVRGSKPPPGAAEPPLVRIGSFQVSLTQAAFPEPGLLARGWKAAVVAARRRGLREWVPNPVPALQLLLDEEPVDGEHFDRAMRLVEAGVGEKELLQKLRGRGMAACTALAALWGGAEMTDVAAAVMIKLMRGSVDELRLVEMVEQVGWSGPERLAVDGP
jgi:hypothetical protein